MDSQPILLEIQDEVAIITLNLPHKLNALNADYYNELAWTLRKVASNEAVFVTIITGKGRYFSAGADVTFISKGGPSKQYGTRDERVFWTQKFAETNLELTRVLLQHPKVLVAALNGPAMGLSAALTGLCDFVYVTEDTFLLTPFTALGLLAEGGASETFVRRMGLSKANEALLLSKRITASELLQCGFANKIFPKPQADGDFRKSVLDVVKREILNPELNRESVLLVKKLIKANFENKVLKQNLDEAFGGIERFLKGVPQKEFEGLASRAKRHKL